MSPKVSGSQGRSGADREVDRLYRDLRGQFGGVDARANGYRFQAYFRAEQRMLLETLGVPGEVVLDAACGSGLMLQSLLAPGRWVIGVDFNEQACLQARRNGVAVIRGDAFDLPLRAGCVNGIISCQFLNQQTLANARRFIEEGARVLQPGGRLIVVWRNGRALIHKIAHAMYRILDRVAGRPTFPCVDHDPEEIRSYARVAGLDVLSATTTMPLLNLRMAESNWFGVHVLGASCVMVLGKPGPSAPSQSAESR